MLPCIILVIPFILKITSNGKYLRENAQSYTPSNFAGRFMFCSCLVNVHQQTLTKQNFYLSIKKLIFRVSNTSRSTMLPEKSSYFCSMYHFPEFFVYHRFLKVCQVILLSSQNFKDFTTFITLLFLLNLVIDVSSRGSVRL